MALSHVEEYFGLIEQCPLQLPLRILFKIASLMSDFIAAEVSRSSHHENLKFRSSKSDSTGAGLRVPPQVVKRSNYAYHLLERCRAKKTLGTFIISSRRLSSQTVLYNTPASTSVYLRRALQSLAIHFLNQVYHACDRLDCEFELLEGCAMPLIRQNPVLQHIYVVP